MGDDTTLWPQTARSPAVKAAAFVVVMFLACTVGTWLVYVQTLDYGFYYDDYHFIRPHSAREVLETFRGPWDTSGIETAYYRPLTIAFYAARFEWFGLDSRAHHLASLIMFAVAGSCVGMFVYLQTRRGGLGVIAAVTFVAHPAMPYALVAWVTNQMHLLETLVVLLSVLWWSYVRASGILLWLPLLPLAAAAFLIKEDGIMLLPLILGLHSLRRRMVESSLPPVSWTFMSLTALSLGLLLVARTLALDGTPGRAVPTALAAWDNFTRGLNGVLRLLPADRPWQLEASGIATLIPVAGFYFWRKTDSRIRFMMVAGILWALAFNLPFVFVTKAEQMHLVAIGGVLMISGSMGALLGQVRGGMFRALARVALVAGIATWAVVARQISTDFAPFGPIVLSTDKIVLEWATVPQELRDYVRHKREPGNQEHLPANPIEAVSVVGFGLHPRETSPGGTGYRWMAQPEIEFHVSPRVRQLKIPLRHELGAFREPVPVSVDANGRPVDALMLDDDDWHLSHITLREGKFWFRSWHRVRVRIPHVWRPSEMIPQSTDSRSLGLQVGQVDAR